MNKKDEMAIITITGTGNSLYRQYRYTFNKKTYGIILVPVGIGTLCSGIIVNKEIEGKIHTEKLYSTGTIDQDLSEEIVSVPKHLSTEGSC